MKQLFIQLIKFGIVGVIALLVDVGVLVLLKEVVCMDVLWASALSFSVSVTVNYILSMRFVFSGAKEGKAKEFIVFVLLSVGGLLLNQLIMWLGTEVWSLYYMWVKVFALLFVPLYNFVTRKLFLEKRESV